MNSVRQSCRPKHQVLILKCYPRYQKGVQDVKPNPSELSYLLYYASTRRSKLQKVGAFLEKRAARDVWRGKLGNVQVTLQILVALIEKVPRDLPLYARSVLTVLDIVLRSREINMVEETIPLFELFCRHQDSATLTGDPEYIAQYRNIVGTYAGFASTDSPSAPKTPVSAPTALRWKSTGLKAVKSVVASEILSTDGAKQLSIVIPVILKNLYASGDFSLSPLQDKARNSERLEREQLRRRRMSISTVQTVDTVEGIRDPETASSSAADADRMAEIETRVMALRCLEKLFSGTNRAQIRLGTSLVLSYIVSRNPFQRRDKESGADSEASGNWATNLLATIADWAPVQDRFIILVTLLETLTDRPLIDGQLEPQLTLVSMMDWLLKSPINLIGLSVMDVLIGLLRFSRSLLQLEDGATRVVVHPERPAVLKPLPQLHEPVLSPATINNEKSPTPDSMRRGLLQLLEQCIGNLATHIYYGDQVSDMIRIIVTRIKPSTEGENSRQESESDRGNSKTCLRSDYSSSSGYFSSPMARITVLKSIKHILSVANQQKSAPGNEHNSRNRVPLQVWDGTPWLLRDPDKEVRNLYVDALLSWLRLETTKSDLRVPAEHPKTPKVGSKKDSLGVPDTLARRVMSSVVHRDSITQSFGSMFLQVLHLTIFDIMTESAVTEQDILVFHLLLANLVDCLGVNATRFTLPVLMKLQSISFSSANKALQVGSLVHGYLLAVVEKFNLEGSTAANDIINEITRRQKEGIWLDKVRVPPLPLDDIQKHPDTHIVEVSLVRSEKNACSSFDLLEDLVNQIESSYNSFYLSPPTSPSNSPGRSLSIGHTNPGQSRLSAGSQLPLHVKDQMLTPWSKESCLAAIEKERMRPSSLSGSRTATAAFAAGRNTLHTSLYNYGPGSPSDTARSGNPQDRPVSAACSPTNGLLGLPRTRRQSIPERSSPPLAANGDPTVHVNDLRRVLSAVNTNNVRHPSPLRGRQRVDSTASSVESMVSDNLSLSDAGTTVGPDRPLSSRENLTHRGSKTQLNGKAPTLRDDNRGEYIPPVPPLPSSLAIPSTPAAASRGSPIVCSPSPARSGRPSTAPGQPVQTRSRNQDGNIAVVRQSRSMTRKKSLNGSFHERTVPEFEDFSGEHAQGYSDDMGDIGIAITADTTETAPHNLECDTMASQWSKHEASRTLSFGRRVDVDKLLEGLAIRRDASGTGEVNGVGGLSNGVEGSPSSVRMGKKPYVQPTQNEHVVSYPRKSGLLSPGAPWTRPASELRSGGIGPPPY